MPRLPGGSGRPDRRVVAGAGSWRACAAVPALGGTGHVRAVLPGRQFPEQERGLGRAERERPQLLEHAVISDKVGFSFQEDSSAGAAQVRNTQPGCS